MPMPDRPSVTIPNFYFFQREITLDISISWGLLLLEAVGVVALNRKICAPIED